MENKHRMKTMIIMFFVLTVLAFAVTACGKKGALEHREGADPTYPRTYPTK